MIGLVKITIDTKEDSRHEIKKVVDMLNAIIEAETVSGGAAGSQELVVGEGIFGMFSSNSEESAPAAQPSGVNELAGFFAENKEESVNLDEQKVVEGVKKADEDEDIRIVPY